MLTIFDSWIPFSGIKSFRFLLVVVASLLCVTSLPLKTEFFRGRIAQGTGRHSSYRPPQMAGNVSVRSGLAEFGLLRSGLHAFGVSLRRQFYLVAAVDVIRREMVSVYG
jgi:hypothetical protein